MVDFEHLSGCYRPQALIRSFGIEKCALETFLVDLEKWRMALFPNQLECDILIAHGAV